MLGKNPLLGYVILALAFWVKNVSCDEEQKGHFQVHNEKEGELKIHATKEIAQIETQASSVQVILEPGIAKIPVVKKDESQTKEEGVKNKDKIRKIIKIESPIYLLGLRRNKINRRKKSKDENSEKVSRALKQGKKTFENSVMLEKWKHQNRQAIKKNAKRVKKSKRSTKIKVKNYRRADVPDRKSEIDREMRVHGKTGGLKIKTGKHGTKLVSHGGYLNVFIRNPDRPEQPDKNLDSNSDRRSKSSNSNYHLVDTEIEGMSLKKDQLPRKEGCGNHPCTP